MRKLALYCGRRRAGQGPHRQAASLDVLDPCRSVLLVIDMQNYFMQPGAQGEIPLAREIVPAVNRLAAELRRRGGHVVWIRNSTKDTRESWSVFNKSLHAGAQRAPLPHDERGP